jgi:formylglycine-generating enzyme required for sulfatase activity/serine/threonine protein kinase
MTGTDPHSLVGEVLADKYEVECVVGEGGFSTVYRARHRVWDRPVALKVFRDDGATTATEQEHLVQAFLREGAILAELSERSSAICQARDAGTVTTRAGVTLSYLVLEWLDGSTLGDLLEVEALRERPLRTLKQAVELLEPIAVALALAHKRGIVHRDLKPENLFVLGDPRQPGCAMKLLDFGVAKVFGPAAIKPGAPTTNPGLFTAFTPAYAAPEQFSRKLGGTGPWTDVYSLALILVQMMSGKYPQDCQDVGMLALLALDPHKRPTPMAAGVAVSDDVEEVFERALAVPPEARFPDVASFWEALHVVLDLDPFQIPVSSERPAATDGKDVPNPAGPAPTEPPPATMALPFAVTTPTPPGAMSWKRRLAIAAPLVALAIGLPVARAMLPKKEPAPAALPPPAPAVAAAPPSTPCAPGMILVPGGVFYMGDDEGAKGERPAHSVQLAPYCIDRVEVTVAAYKECSDHGKCKRAGLTNSWDGITDADAKAYDPLCNARDVEAHASHPVNCVDWSMASRYCDQNDLRLPTEAEWELAARGHDGRSYPWGEAAPDPTRLNACGPECVAWGKARSISERPLYREGDGWETTAPVGSFPKGASPFGVLDMAGNVGEWVEDWYGSYGSSEAQNPAGPSSGAERVVRGGAWNASEPSWVRPTFRFHAPPGERSHGIGFRCASSVMRS